MSLFYPDNPTRVGRAQMLNQKVQSIKCEINSAIKDLERRGHEYYKFLEEEFARLKKPSIQRQREQALEHLSKEERAVFEKDFTELEKHHAGLAKLQMIVICAEAGLIVVAGGGMRLATTVATGIYIATTARLVHQAMSRGRLAADLVSNAAQRGLKLARRPRALTRTGAFRLNSVEQAQRVAAFAQWNRTTTIIRGIRTASSVIGGVLGVVGITSLVYDAVEGGKQCEQLQRDIRALCEIRFETAILKEEFLEGKKWVEQQVDYIAARQPLASLVTKRKITQQDMDEELRQRGLEVPVMKLSPDDAILRQVRQDLQEFDSSLEAWTNDDKPWNELVNDELRKRTKEKQEANKQIAQAEQKERRKQVAQAHQVKMAQHSIWVRQAEQALQAEQARRSSNPFPYSPAAKLWNSSRPPKRANGDKLRNKRLTDEAKKQTAEKQNVEAGLTLVEHIPLPAARYTELTSPAYLYSPSGGTSIDSFNQGAWLEGDKPWNERVVDEQKEQKRQEQDTGEWIGPVNIDQSILLNENISCELSELMQSARIHY